MKTKHLYILAIGLMSLLFFLFLGVLPFLLFVYSPWIAVSIVLALGIGGLILYMRNIPAYHMDKFYAPLPITKIEKPEKLRFTYRESKYSFSCGQAVIQMVLEHHGIIMTQDQILEISGDKTLGATSWELEEALNTIFHEKGLALKARTNYFTTYAQLFDAVHKRKAVIVMFINHFTEKGFSSQANYPHFALLNYINMSSEEQKNRVILTSPGSAVHGNKNFAPGEYEGEIVIPFQQFQERFYVSSKFLNHLEYKPTYTKSRWRNGWNRFLNLLFIFSFYISYCTRVLKPGLAIFVESVERK